MTRCPICRCDNVSGRNRKLEELAAKLSVNCSFQRYGCPFAGKIKNMQDHEKYCVHRTMLCPHHNCDERGSQKELLQHLRAYHEATVTTANCAHMTISNESPKQTLIVHGPQDSYIVALVEVNNSYHTINVTPMYLPSKASFRHRMKTPVILKWKRDCHYWKESCTSFRCRPLQVRSQSRSEAFSDFSSLHSSCMCIPKFDKFNPKPGLGEAAWRCDFVVEVTV